MGVSENRDTPKSSILIGISIIFTIHFGGFPTIFGNTTILGWSLVPCHLLLPPLVNLEIFSKSHPMVFGKLPDSKRRRSWCFLWWFPHVSTYTYIIYIDCIYRIYMLYIYRFFRYRVRIIRNQWSSLFLQLYDQNSAWQIVFHAGRH